MIRAQLSHALSLVLLATALGACNTSPSASPSASPTPSLAPVPSISESSRQAYGVPISSKDSVTLPDLARDPAAWSNKSLVTSGSVVSVCPNMGCWMVIEDQGVQAMVRMANHAFRVPKDSAGKHARVQAVANSPAAAAPFKCPHGGHACGEKGHARQQGSQVQLEASGVELF